MTLVVGSVAVAIDALGASAPLVKEKLRERKILFFLSAQIQPHKRKLDFFVSASGKARITLYIKAFVDVVGIFAHGDNRLAIEPAFVESDDKRSLTIRARFCCERRSKIRL